MINDYEEVTFDASMASEAICDKPTCTDLANAWRFAIQTAGKARYVPKWRRWIVWDGSRWRRDDDGMVWRLARDVVKDIFLEAGNAETDGEAKAIGKWAIQSHSEKRLKSMLNLASTEEGIPVDVAVLDRDPFAFNVQNGTIDLRTGQLRPHDPNDMITKISSVMYDPAAKAPRFERFVSEIMAGNSALVDFLQRAIGYTLTGDCRERCLFILHGLGKNGKSTLLDIVREVIGDNSANTPIATLMSKRDAGVRNDIARLQGVRLVYANESDEQQKLNEGLMKELTGRDEVTARFLYSEQFSFIPQFKIWLSTNHKPEIKGTDPAIWDRIRLVPFQVRFEGQRDEQDLPQVLRSELPGILRWAVQGCLSWQADGLKAPQEITHATSEYRREMDVLAEFLSFKCMIAAACRVKASDLHKAYTTWAKDTLETPINQRAFGLRMTERGFKRVKSNGGIFHYLGIALRKGDDVDEGDELPESPMGGVPGSSSSSSPSSPLRSSLDREPGDESEEILR